MDRGFKPQRPVDPGPNLTPARTVEVEEFVKSDPVAKRFFLFFDALRLRGVEKTQSSRTAHLATSGTVPSDGGPE